MLHTPGQRSLADALGDSSALASLRQRIAASNARLAAIEGLLPAPLRAQVQAGPIDEEQWVLLVSGQAVAAKLRHMAPLISASLAQAGLALPPLRIKLLEPR